MPHVLIKPSSKLFELSKNSLLTELEDVKETVIPFCCRVGACGSCAIEVMEGILNLNKADYRERTFLTRMGYPEERYRLACKCRLQGDITIKPIGR